MEFQSFPKMARLSRESLVTEKIDGTNAQILITKLTDYMPTPKEAITIAGGTLIMAGSRTRWITPENDNFGFAAWVAANATDLLGLGEGRHYGEWWGCLTGETSVKLADGTLEKMWKIVRDKMDVEVLSYNFARGVVEPKRIIGHKVAEATDDWLTIGFKRKHRGGRAPHLNVTPNHILYVKGESGLPEEIAAGDLKVGDQIFLMGKRISELQKQLLLGSNLGDGCISHHSFQVGHSNHQLVDEKVSILGNLVASIHERVSGKGSKMKVLSTVSHPYIRHLEELQYQDGIKDISAGCIDAMGPAAFAFWMADDGCTQFSDVRRAVTMLHTNGFTEMGVRAAAKVMAARGYENYIVLNAGKPVIKFTPDGTERFHLDIAPFMPWSMKYKMLPQYRNVPPIWEVMQQSEESSPQLVATEVTSITRDYAEGKRNKKRYDIEVEDNHNFFANGILVHNSGIQRKYGQTQNHFSLFNALRWVEHDQEPGIIPTGDPRITKMQERAPSCCRVVPVLARGEFTTDLVEGALDMLRQNGSYAAPGFMNPEGVVVFHVAGNVGFKATLDGDGHKGR